MVKALNAFRHLGLVAYPIGLTYLGYWCWAGLDASQKETHTGPIAVVLFSLVISIMVSYFHWKFIGDRITELGRS